MRFSGTRTFLLIWSGQVVSLLGTAMTRFALLIWAYEQSGSATALALLGFFSFIPFILLSPIAGVVVDRVDRRLVMLATDLGAGLMTVTLLVLYRQGDLQLWHLYLAQGLTGSFEAFQYPAYTAATTMLVPKAFYNRANGLRSLADATSQVGAPFLAGLLLVTIDIDGVMLIDVGTFLVAVSILALVRIPSPAPTGEARLTWRQELGFGVAYIRRRSGLLGLMFIFVGMNFFATLTYFSILPAMVLARTAGNELALASVQAALGAGGVVGGILVSLWAGPRRRVHLVLSGAAASFLLGDLLFALGRTVEVWVVAAFLAAFFIPFIVSGDRSIWQSKVAPHVQGKVFATKGMLQQASMPLGYLLAGPLADQLFEPAMQGDSGLAALFGPLVGTGPGAGIGVMFLFTALAGTAMSLSGYLIPAVRNVESELPDFDETAGPSSTGRLPA